MARLSLEAFFRAAWRVVNPATPLEWGPHIAAVIYHIETQLRDRWRARDSSSANGGVAFIMRAQNLLINVAPRSLKSTILAIACAWAWLHEPTMSILALSANPQVSLVNARIVHTLIQDPWYQSIPGAVTLNTDRSALTDFGVCHWIDAKTGKRALSRVGAKLVNGGSRVARGLDSNITGVGSDWIQIDDPHDVRDSEAQIKSTVDGYDAAVHNRVNDPRTSIRTAIMQRFRVDDFSGHVLEKHGRTLGLGGGWLHVRIPTEFRTAPGCGCGTCIGANVYGWIDWRTKEGELLHSRMTPEFVEAEKRRLGPYGYEGQHQQEPSPPTGGMWRNRWFGWFRLPEDGDPGAWKRPAGCNADSAIVVPRNKAGKSDMEMLVISLDGTFGNLKEHEGSAVGFGLFARRKGEWLWLEDKTEPISYLETLDRIRDTAKRWAHEAPMRLLVEPKAFGPQAVEQLRRDVSAGFYVDQDGNRHPFVDRNGKRVIMVVEVVRGADVDGEGRKGVAGDKITRFYAASPALAAGLLRLREGAPWVHAAVTETGQFPKGSRDDRVDIVTQLINHYGEGGDLAHARAMLLR